MKLRINQKLHSLREERRLTQAEFAELLGLSQGAYGRLERGETLVDFEQLMRFSETLNVPITDFLPETLIVHTHNQNGHGGVGVGNYYDYTNNDPEKWRELEHENIRLQEANNRLEQQLQSMKEENTTLKSLIEWFKSRFDGEQS
jgi:transcriptional regulator with XRE-family HTH domain